ncbi:MBL fold metallo-hydrolase [Abyssisolibacter fermentans]|uniref:MBL fold metallo-hydrolase n=1 Tax=Abyssisolibacter fermentans TaxID=1766203 RepID=UPI00082E7FB1|nr:MBL fold metallo-hydrolase [Abyssisolibacter fermentans]
MKLTVLGNNGPYPRAGGACSGYLIETDDTKILLDCGNGVLSRLQKICKIDELDAIIISHLHSDHISDIFILKYAIGLNLEKMQKAPIPLYMPMDNECFIQQMNYNNAFNIIQIDEETTIDINNLEISFKKMTHPVESYAIKILTNNRSFVYSGDTSYNDQLPEFIKNIDFFLCEASVLEKDRKIDTPHLSVKQAAQMAQNSIVKRLLLTHFWPEYKLEDIMAEASTEYNSILQLSEEMRAYYI